MGIPLHQAKAELFRTMGHPVRVRVLELLQERPRAVHELLDEIDVEASNLSQQLAVLRNKNIVPARKEGSNVYYSVTDKTVFKLLDVARDIFNNHLIGVRSILEEIHLEQPQKTVRR